MQTIVSPMSCTLFVTPPLTQGKRVCPRTKNKGHLFITNLPNIPYKKKLLGGRIGSPDVPQFINCPVRQVTSFFLDNGSNTNRGQVPLVLRLLVPFVTVGFLLKGTG